MKLWHFYFTINREAFPKGKVYKKLKKIKKSKWTTSLDFDFQFLSDFFSRYLELKIRKLKYEGQYGIINIELAKDYNIIEGTEGIAIQIPFDIDKFKELYPAPNLIPLQYGSLINPVSDIDKFNNFLFQIVLGALEYTQKKRYNIPTEYLITELNNFKQDNFKREWYHQKKAFKEKGISARLFCKQDCNTFTLELVVLKKRNEIYRKQIGQANPAYLMYRVLLGELKIWNDKLLVVEKHQDYKPIEKQQLIFELDLNTLL